MTDKLQTIEAQRFTRNNADVKVGDWYWVTFDDMEWQGKGDKAKQVKIGEHELLMCVDGIGSNYVGFSAHTGKNRGWDDMRVHYDEFFKRCRPEPNWKEHLRQESERVQLAIKAKTQELIEAGKALCLLPHDELQEVQPESSFLPVKVSSDPKEHKNKLIKFRDKSLPAISKEIDELAIEYGVIAQNMALPDIIKLQSVKEALGVVEDRIFTIELYCGLQEEVEQIADGKPAGMDEKIAIRQMLLFMDEETIFDYESGGMDFEKVSDFDKWVVKPENLNRILPEKKGIVAFRVRRHDKNYGTPSSLLNAWIQMGWNEANKQTYLLLRNGEKVYRILSAVDFSPRLIPRRGEIGDDQFKKIDSRWDWSEDKHKRVETVEVITPDNVEYDDRIKMVDDLLRKYNRMVILIQGLLDRSAVFHPHPPINLAKAGTIDEWVQLIRDEEDGLPCNVIDWKQYRAQLNSTLEKGKWIRVQFPEVDKYGNYYDEETKERRKRPHRGYMANEMPRICKVDAIKRDRSAVKVSWSWGSRAKPKQGKWIESKTKPGWGHYETIWETDRMCHEWVPMSCVINISDYTPGDYKMFLCDRTLQGKYLVWAPFLLTAEDWHRRRKAGMKAEEDPQAQVRK